MKKTFFENSFFSFTIREWIKLVKISATRNPYQFLSKFFKNVLVLLQIAFAVVMTQKTLHRTTENSLKSPPIFANSDILLSTH